MVVAAWPPRSLGLWELLGAGSRALVAWRVGGGGWDWELELDPCELTELGLVCNIYSLLVGLDIGLGPSVLG